MGFGRGDGEAAIGCHSWGTNRRPAGSGSLAVSLGRAVGEQHVSTSAGSTYPGASPANPYQPQILGGGQSRRQRERVAGLGRRANPEVDDESLHLVVITVLMECCSVRSSHNILRISCTAAHTDEHVDRLVETLYRVSRRLGSLESSQPHQV